MMSLSCIDWYRDVEDLSQTVETTRLKRFLHAIYPYDPGKNTQKTENH